MILHFSIYIYKQDFVKYIKIRIIYLIHFTFQEFQCKKNRLFHPCKCFNIYMFLAFGRCVIILFKIIDKKIN